MPQSHGFNMNKDHQFLKGDEPHDIIGSAIEAVKQVLAEGVVSIEKHLI